MNSLLKANLLKYRAVTNKSVIKNQLARAAVPYIYSLLRSVCASVQITPVCIQLFFQVFFLHICDDQKNNKPLSEHVRVIKLWIEKYFRGRLNFIESFLSTFIHNWYGYE